MLSYLLIVRANLRLQIDTQFYRNIGGREPRSSSNVGSGSVSVNSAPSVLSPILLFTDMPDHTTLYRFLKRLEDDTLERGLGETVRRLRRGKTHGRVSATVDGTGLSPQAVRWLVVVDVKQQVVLAQQARQGPWVDTRALPGLVDAAARCAPLRLVLADRVRFRSEPSAHSATLWRAKHYSGTTSPGCSARNPAQSDVPRFSSEKVWTTSESGNDLLRGETQTFLPRSRPQSEFTDPPSIAPRPRLQPVSPQASPRYRGSQQSYFISL